MLSGYRPIGPITRAGFSDQYKVPQILLEHGADPNYTASMDCTAMLWAAFHNAQNTVKLLLQYGANPDVVSVLCLESNVPLHITCVRDFVSIVALLIQAFCDVNKPAKLLQLGYRNLHQGGGDQVGSNFNMQFFPLKLCVYPLTRITMRILQDY